MVGAITTKIEKQEFKIEKEVPIPKSQKKGFRNTRYPFNKMEIGDSFFVENYTRESMQQVSNAGRSYFRYKGNYDKVTVACRKEGTGFRVWVVNKNNREV
jgi:hypothetical protein